MEAVRESWTDARLDDGFDRVAADVKALRHETGALRKDLQTGFDGLRKELHTEIGGVRKDLHTEIGGLRKELHTGISGVRKELHTELGGLRKELHAEIGSLRTETIARFDRVDSRFDDLQRTMMLLGGGVGTGIIAALIGVIATQL
jgi:hypothetical protein